LRSHDEQSVVAVDAIIARTVRRHRPQSDPAPHALATSLQVDAPRATASATTWLVAPVHRHTYIGELVTAPVSIAPNQPSR